jgi:hypothetical protein
VLYQADGGVVTDLLIGPGYLGTLVFKSANGDATYVLSMNSAYIQKTSTEAGLSQLIFDWTDTAALNGYVNEIYDGLRATYHPSLPHDVDCTIPTTDGGTADCVVGNNGSGGGYFSFPRLDMVIYFASTVGSAQQKSDPLLIDFTNPAAH